ncbi:2-oxoacid dehydrogenases acyltransferase (catalytic domain) [Raineyella antarctica]|uniref:2-oxoacid dehydrogenases acyltransferase (Catalytic domain) n=1 Tax=Raineyella antarctica TaxID=1577474 RepID=A0A1G6I3H3_9ACTN|nr:2-oxo acid dehydrogenase subunit E2 [Raineyella antarctica]SDC01092.1 2-oxoacid dehydrogenases acyltransferase (catalytic domain) [Raineyella antarctica]
MFFTRRRDGIHLPDVPAMRRIMPYLMPTRLESTIYYPQRLEVDHLLDWLAQVNERRPRAERITFFHVFLAAFARLFRQRPELNRFIAGRRTYAHKEISFSFAVKKALTDEAPETQVRLVFTGAETIDEVRDIVDREVVRARGTDRSGSDVLTDVLASWPRPALNGLARLLWGLDDHNLLPGFLQDAIPLYASAYIVNLGSLGGEAPFHHLYQRGTASVFAAIGAIRPEALVDQQGHLIPGRCVTISYTIDERATDGFYFVHSAHVLQGLLADPEQLTRPPTD